MTAAAFKATFADWKVIKSRAAVQLVFEIPIEQADAAYQALGGMPVAAREVWCAIARLTSPQPRTSPAEATPRPATAPQLAPVGDEIKERRPFASLPLPQQAALRCNDPIYRAFLREICGKSARDENEAAEVIRDLCGVESRRDIRAGTEAEKSWLELEQWFAAWQTEERAMA